jgi:hypothetical protein
MALWQALLVAVGGNSALLLVIAYLGRSLIGTVLTKDVEEFKSQLTKDVEKFKADLQLAAIEHEIQFSKLHEKRAEVVAEVYKLLVAATWQTESFASLMEWVGEPDKKQKYREAMDAITEYFRFFDQHRIYMPAELCDSLESFARKLRSPTLRFGRYLRFDYPNDSINMEKFKVWTEAWESAQNEIPSLRSALETEFRKLLGGGR